MTQPQMQRYQIHYKCKNPSDIPKVINLMRQSGMEEIIETPKEWMGNIRGVLRATDIGEAEHQARQITNSSGGFITAMHIRNLSQDEPKAKKHISTYLKEIFSF
ncbi:MAG: hypothetical protein KGH66_03030 [Candidatus Micrarchaeota archaeon]|nr:hypothetical protein [Candidatus Micrarchaeota archaeon]